MRTENLLQRYFELGKSTLFSLSVGIITILLFSMENPSTQEPTMSLSNSKELNATINLIIDN